MCTLLATAQLLKPSEISPPEHYLPAPNTMVHDVDQWLTLSTFFTLLTLFTLSTFSPFFTIFTIFTLSLRNHAPACTYGLHCSSQQTR